MSKQIKNAYSELVKELAKLKELKVAQVKHIDDYMNPSRLMIDSKVRDQYKVVSKKMMAFNGTNAITDEVEVCPCCNREIPPLSKDEE